MPYTYKYPRCALTVDCVVFGFTEGELNILLIERGQAPFKGFWALPGGFVKLDEMLNEAARRELYEEAGLSNVFLEQLYTFGAVDRDPRERVVSVAYYALVKSSAHEARAATDATNARWFPISGIPKLAFDHDNIVRTAVARLQAKVRYQPIGFELLPPKFTLSQLQHLYEAILQTTLDKRNFRKKVLSYDLLVPLKETLQSGRHRPAQLFRFNAGKYEQLKKRGFNFEV